MHLAPSVALDVNSQVTKLHNAILSRSYSIRNTNPNPMKNTNTKSQMHLASSAALYVRGDQTAIMPSYLGHPERFQMIASNFFKGEFFIATKISFQSNAKLRCPI